MNEWDARLRNSFYFNLLIIIYLILFFACFFC